MEDLLYTVPQVAKICHSNEAYIYKLINNGLLPCLKMGRYKVRKSSLEDFLKKYEGYDITEVNEIKALEFTS